ncbi:putative ATPase/DNA-binding winged helix-turn-helix (wHTH) protein [Paraburkholderia sp. GAS199]|uniref:ATP-binding protein n=1 Tax=Paraburkholderia sp. GAS199 TaxID=3035126 RepID=UPI003D192543
MTGFGPFDLDTDRREIRRHGEVLPIGSRAFDILCVLAMAAGRVVSKDELMRAVWPDTIVEENNIQVHLSALRKELGRDWIVTVPGRGYQLVQRRTLAVDSVALSARPASSEPATARMRPLPQRSAVIGRERAVVRVREQLASNRVLTLIGAGGIGKTTLALAVGREIAATLPDYVCFVSLDALSSRDAILGAMAESLGLSVADSAPRVEWLAATLRGEERLLLLDNVEHVAGHVAEIVEKLITLNGALRVLVTSREPLRIGAEVLFWVEPLDVPPRDAASEDLPASSAVDLFLSRTRALRHDPPSNDTELLLVGEICRRLDGIPLAIELAAAQVATLGVAGVHQRLDDRMALLSGGYRTALPRHQTLRATFDWSFRLLRPSSQRLFCRLAMFGGLFTLDAMCAVACDADLGSCMAINGIDELVSKSMVSVEYDGPVAKYRLTESSRAYAFERLAESGETRAVLSRAARVFAQRLRSTASHALADSGSLPELHQSLDDARGALDWALSDVGDARLGVELSATMVNALLDCRMLDECERRAASAVRAIDLLPPGSIRPSDEIDLRAALAIVLLNRGGPVEQGTRLWLDVLRLAMISGDDAAQARALWGLWGAMMAAGEVHHALAYASRLQRFAQEQGHDWQGTLAKVAAAIASHYQGQHAGARAQLETVLQHVADHPDEAAAIRHFAADTRVMASCSLARIAWLAGDVQKAMAFADSAVALVEPGRTEPWLTHLLALVATPLALQSGDAARARHYLGALRAQTALHDFAVWREYGEGLAGWLDLIEEHTERGLAALEHSLDSLQSRGYRRLSTPLVVAHAEALIANGRAPESLERLREAREFCHRHGEMLYLPEIWRAEGVALVALADQAGKQPDSGHAQYGELQDAQACFDESVRIARAHGAPMLVLRTTLCIARLYLRQQRQCDALACLLGVAASFDPASSLSEIRTLFAMIDALKSPRLTQSSECEAEEV